MSYVTIRVDVRHIESWRNVWHRNDVNSQILTTELRDFLYNQWVENTCCCTFFFFIYPTDRIMVCKIRFVSTGENPGKHCPANIVRYARNNYLYCYDKWLHWRSWSSRNVSLGRQIPPIRAVKRTRRNSFTCIFTFHLLSSLDTRIILLCTILSLSNH